jgi:transposase InsO family protein
MPPCGRRAIAATVAAVLDLVTREIVEWAMRDHMRTELPLAALMMAAHRQRPVAGLICHSDRGSQYAAGARVDHLATIGATPSMSRTANCYDNAPMRVSSTPSRSNSSIGVGGRHKPRCDKHRSGTSRATTTGTACTRPSGI